MGCFVYVTCDSVKLAFIWTYCINQRSNIINYGWAAWKLHTSEARVLELLMLIVGMKLSKINTDTAMNCAWLLSSPAIHPHHHMLGGKGKRFTKEGSEQWRTFIHLYSPLFRKCLNFFFQLLGSRCSTPTQKWQKQSSPLRKKRLICQAM